MTTDSNFAGAPAVDDLEQRGREVITSSTGSEEGAEKSLGYLEVTVLTSIMILELDPIPPGGDHGRCPIRGVLDCIGDRWSVLTLAALSRGTLRFTEVRRVVGHVSQRVLAQTLRKLERDGYVRRKVYPTIPPKVEYSLTALGQSLVSELKLLVDWAKENGMRVLEAREAYVPPAAHVAL